LLRISRVIIPVLVLLICLGLVVEGESADDLQSGADVAAADKVGKTKPQIESPKGPPPTELEVTDLVTGTGAEAREGDVVRVEYVVLLQKSGKEVFSSWGSEPLSFELGGSGGGVTLGWQQGIEGMREGGRRKLVAPARLSYGKAGNPPAIGPDEALVSVIDLLAVKSSRRATGRPGAELLRMLAA
jgi:peptidylprolyl isomerase